MPADATPRQTVTIHELQHVVVGNDVQRRQLPQQVHSLCAIPEAAENQLSDHEWMGGDGTVFKIADQCGNGSAEMIDPDRRIDEDHREPLAGRRLRGARARLSEPPSAARRCALRWAISARKPACTTAVFSARPVRLRAFSSNASSRINVVRICIIVPCSYAYVKPAPGGQTGAHDTAGREGGGGGQGRVRQVRVQSARPGSNASIGMIFAPLSLQKA